MPKIKRKSQVQKQRDNKLAKRQKREDSLLRQAEQIVNTAARRESRKDSLRREAEQSTNTAARRKSRKDSLRREAEQSTNTAARRESRRDSLRREAEQSTNTAARRESRRDSLRRETEQSANTAARRESRRNSLRRETEQSANTAARRESRRNSLRRETEQCANTAARRESRKDSVRRHAEQFGDTTARRESRKDSLRRKAEQSADTAAHRESRKDSLRRETEQSADTAAHRESRKDSLRRETEQSANTAARRESRKDSVRRVTEQSANTAAHRESRNDCSRRQAEQKRKNKLRREKAIQSRSKYESLLNSYLRKMKTAPSFICSTCGGLWYEDSTTITSVDKLSARGCTEDFISKILHVDQLVHRLCSTCKISVYKMKIPRLCLSNGFDFPVIPDEIKELSPLEERLVAARIPFMQIRFLGSERQSVLRGNVVNVENDLNKCAAVLPRSFDETSTIQVKLMRRMEYKHPYMYETIRPLKVYLAAKYLITSEAYESENIILSEDWSRCQEEDTLNFVCSTTNPSTTSNSEIEVDSEKSEEEDAKGIEARVANTGVEETLFFSEKETARKYFGRKIAPAEDNIPIALQRDTNAEVLSFPTIYAGKIRKFTEGLKISYTDIAKSELRRYDRRACQPSKILYTFKMSFNEKLINAIQICLRKTNKNEKLTAGSARSLESVKHLMDCDDGYAVFKHIRSSPAYWKEQSKRVLAMIRQLGKPALFITLSAAETKWTELLNMLYKISKRTDITDEDISNMEFDEIAKLIRNDPVTCMRHFDHRLRALQTTLFKPAAGIFAPYGIHDYFSRLEFQMRGSPHSHGLYWVEDAPTFDEDDADSVRTCTEFIDQYITCERSEDKNMEKIIGYQIHRHSHTCTKRSKKCRFGFPQPPLDVTRILTPLAQDFDPGLKKRSKDLFKKIKSKLQDDGKKFTRDTDFDTFLEMIDTSYGEYILALRSSIHRVTVFLKRQPNAIYVNGYNAKLLQAWGANIDVQFIIDTYACAKYCVGYILKAEGGISKLLQALTQDIKRGNMDAREQLKQFARVLLNGSEVSAQEASAFLLGIPNTYCTKQDVFINTALPDERISILKPLEELENLNEESLDICVKGLIDHYIVRPEELDDISLADFASIYEYSKRNLSNIDENYDINTTTLVDNTRSKLIRFKLKDNSGFIRKRTTRKIIRYRHYGKAQDPENYCREQIMLFLPWRNEQQELIAVDAIEKYNGNYDTILHNCKPFIFNRAIDDRILDTLINDIEAEFEDEDDANPLLDEDLETLAGENYNNEDLHDSTMGRSSRVEKFLPPRLVDEDIYLELMRNLNQKQRKFVLNNLYLLKTGVTSFHSFLSGGAGVGKSHVITATVQSYLRFCCKFPNTNPDQICVLVSAPTGKAAFNVFGMTLHCSFKLPPNQYGGKLVPLEEGAANSLRIKLEKTKLFIIDEISMVSVKQLYDIDQRLRQLFSTPEDFGGKSILVVGHLRQLPPIGGSYVFKDPSHLPLGELVGNHLWKKFQLYELDEIMRQKGDHNFCKALNNMAEGTMDAEDISLIRSREVTNENIPPREAIRLFQTNDECEIYNNEVHSKLGTEGVVSTAYDKIQGHGTEEQKKTLKEFAKTFDRQKCDGLPYETHLQVGCEFFVSTNIEVQDGLFNGSTGALKHIEYGSTSKDVRVPIRGWMDFRNPLIGIRKKVITRKHQQKKGINLEWVGIDRITVNLSKTHRHGGLEIIRKQIPLVACNGMTIAKSQGSTMSSVVIHVSRYHGENQSSGVKHPRERKLSRENLYVACSRSTSLTGLYIYGKFQPPETPKPNDPVSVEMARLRALPFSFSIRFLQDYDDNYEKIFVHNVQSFQLHYLDVISDNCCMASNVICFIEPHVIPTDAIEIQKYTCIHRSNCSGSRNSEGALIFQKENLDGFNATYFKHRWLSGHCLFISFSISNIQALLMYKSPKYPAGNFIEKLTEVLLGIQGNVVIFGDININLRNEDGRVFKNTMSKLGLQSILDTNIPSTDGGTHLDCCFSNVMGIEAWFYESYFSYHKPICIVWRK